MASSNERRQLPPRNARSIAFANINLQYDADEEDDHFPVEISRKLRARDCVLGHHLREQF